VFDSGVGGLTVLKALAAELPHEHFVYLGDTARLPYGTKSPETVARYALQAAEALLDYGVKCLVIACNTASSVGLPAIRERIEGIPVVGVIEPGADAACAASRSGHIAVIATEGTVRGRAYQEAILRLRDDARVIAQPTQLFVALAEEGLHEGSIADSVARHYLEPIFHLMPVEAGTDEPGARPDTLVLGCTHFPMLVGAIRAAVGPHVQIVDSAETTARAVRRLLDEQNLRHPGASIPEEQNLTPRGGPWTPSEGASGPSVVGRPVAPMALAASAPRVRFLATDSAERFARIGSRFLARSISPDEVELIDL
jgi:glutamate racemase